MGCNCGNKNKCGCKNDSPIKIEKVENQRCREKCSEVFLDECIMHGPTKLSVSIEGVNIEIDKGERMDSVLQKILLFFQDYNGYTSAAKEFKIVSYTDDSIELEWKKENFNYIVEYKYDDIIIPLEVGNVGRYEIINLEQDKEYVITIITKETEARSVSLTFKL